MVFWYFRGNVIFIVLYDFMSRRGYGFRVLFYRLGVEFCLGEGSYYGRRKV